MDELVESLYNLRMSFVKEKQNNYPLFGRGYLRLDHEQQVRFTLDREPYPLLGSVKPNFYETDEVTYIGINRLFVSVDKATNQILTITFHPNRQFIEDMYSSTTLFDLPDDEMKKEIEDTMRTYYLPNKSYL